MPILHNISRLKDSSLINSSFLSFISLHFFNLIIFSTIFNFSSPVNAQIHILAPKALRDAFIRQQGTVYGTTATFGAPYFGSRVLGKLHYSASKNGKAYCEPDDYDVEGEGSGGSGSDSSSSSSDEKNSLLPIIIVRRGQCSFAQKVKVAAEHKNAAAVIIVDRGTEGNRPAKTTEQIQATVMADDEVGTGQSVKIPSILVSHHEGEQLIQAVQEANGVIPIDKPEGKEGIYDGVIVKLAWDIPQTSYVTADLWFSSGSREANRFLTEFSAVAQAFKEHLSFVPHYHIVSLPPDSDAASLCLPESSTSRGGGRRFSSTPNGFGRRQLLSVPGSSSKTISNMFKKNPVFDQLMKKRILSLDVQLLNLKNLRNLKSMSTNSLVPSSQVLNRRSDTLGGSIGANSKEGMRKGRSIRSEHEHNDDESKLKPSDSHSENEHHESSSHDNEKSEDHDSEKSDHSQKHSSTESESEHNHDEKESHESHSTDKHDDHSTSENHATEDHHESTHEKTDAHHDSTTTNTEHNTESHQHETVYKPKSTYSSGSSSTSTSSSGLSTGSTATSLGTTIKSDWRQFFRIGDKNKFCAADPDGTGKATGAQVVEEDLRQICLFKVSEKWKNPETAKQTGSDSSTGSKLSMWNDWRDRNELFGYSQQWWKYVVDFWKTCTKKGRDFTDFTAECSYQVMEQIFKDTEENTDEAQDALKKVKECARDPDSRRNLLNKELRNHSWSPLALRINGWRYSGPIEGSLVTRSICGGYLKRPKECDEYLNLLEGGGALGGFGGRYGGARPQSNGWFGWLFGTSTSYHTGVNNDPNAADVAVVTFTKAFMFFGVLVTLSGVLFGVYKRYLTSSLRHSLREEVMLEVRSQMADYAPLEGAPRGNGRFNF